MLPIAVAIKSFFGLYVLTPFETELLSRLSSALRPEARDVLAHQLDRFTTVRRLVRHIDEPNAHGFTNFYSLRFGKDVSATRQTIRFNSTQPEEKLAEAHVSFDGGEIDVQFWLVRGLLFRIEYRSPQKIYYPPTHFRIDTVNVMPPFAAS